MEPAVSLCVLCYGDQAALHRRCLDSVLPLWRAGCVDLRVGGNALCTETTDFLYGLSREAGRALPPHLNLSAENRLKYPVMRALFQGGPPLAPLVLWFDDDSCLRPGVEALSWLETLERVMRDGDMAGSFYRQSPQGQQWAWVQAQPWYRGKHLERGTFSFLTGGFWCIRRALLEQHDWPDPRLRHRGGDVILGELCRQQGYRLVPFEDGVAINAGPELKNCTAPRRGHDERPLGFDGPERA